MSDIQQQEEENHFVATEAEWDRASARELGEANTKHCWILTNRDVWYLNPFYEGPIKPHPEDYDGDDEPFDDDEIESS
jgi:hypothetical protein|tara:strand:+ start:83 stop:316 length:234 start_codon:yes stop_codon:yes gene_type:complete